MALTITALLASYCVANLCACVISELLLTISRLPKKSIDVESDLIIQSRCRIMEFCRNLTNKVIIKLIACLVLTFAGFRGRGHHARSVFQRTPGLQRQTSDKSICLAQNTEDFLQEEQLLH